MRIGSKQKSEAIHTSIPPNAKGAITRAFTKQSGQPATRIYVLPNYRLIFLKEISNDFSIECSLFISFVRAPKQDVETFLLLKEKHPRYFAFINFDRKET